MPYTTFLEPLKDCLTVSVLTGLALSHLLGWPWLAIFAGHMLLWLLADMALMVLLMGPAHTPLHRAMACWLLQEVADCACIALISAILSCLMSII